MDYQNPSDLNDSNNSIEKDETERELTNNFEEIEKEFRELHVDKVVKIQAVIRKKLIMNHYQMICVYILFILFFFKRS